MKPNMNLNVYRNMKMIVKLEVKLNLNQDIPNSKCESECVTNFYVACL